MEGSYFDRGEDVLEVQERASNGQRMFKARANINDYREVASIFNAVIQKHSLPLKVIKIDDGLFEIKGNFKW